MPPISQLPFTLSPTPPAPIPDQIWHSSIEKVPELITAYMSHPKINTRIDHIEICLSLRNFRDTTKQLHWCLMFSCRDTISVAIEQDKMIQVFHKEEAWLVDPCSALGGKGRGFLQFLNEDALAARRLTLRSVAIFQCLAPPGICWFVGSVLQNISLNPKKELFCWAVVKACAEEFRLVHSTHIWALALLQALPCFDYDPLTCEPSDRIKEACRLTEQEMRTVSSRELGELTRER